MELDFLEAPSCHHKTKKHWTFVVGLSHMEIGLFEVRFGLLVRALCGCIKNKIFPVQQTQPAYRNIFSIVIRGDICLLIGF